MNIEYSETDREGIDIIAPLWEKLNEHHGGISRHFSFDYPRRTWENRKKELLSEAADLRVDLATEISTGLLVGYCVSSITDDSLGEIESIFVELDYRRHGIGDILINKALQWLKSVQSEKIIVQIIVDNIEVYSFYERYGFYPRSTIYMKMDENDTSGS